jgi:hypothetical protein
MNTKSDNDRTDVYCVPYLTEFSQHLLGVIFALLDPDQDSEYGSGSVTLDNFMEYNISTCHGPGHREGQPLPPPSPA